MRIHLPEKVICIKARRVDDSLCLPKLKSITVFLIDFSTMNENVLLSLFPKDFPTSFSKCYENILM